MSHKRLSLCFSLLTLFSLSSCAFSPEEIRKMEAEKCSSYTCTYEDGYTQGVNAGMEKKPMQSHLDFCNQCDPASLQKLKAGYVAGYREGLQASEKNVHIVVKNDFGGVESCSEFKDRSCNGVYGDDKKFCQLCKNEKSCFMDFSGLEKDFCEAYWDDRPCMIAFDSKIDRGWCENIKENKNCFMAFDGDARKACEDGMVPGLHLRWLSYYKAKKQP